MDGEIVFDDIYMAKIGCLILNGGKWNDKQIISKEWIEKIKPLHRFKEPNHMALAGG